MTIQVVNDKKAAITHRLRSSVWLLGLGAAVGWFWGCGGGRASEPVALVSITVAPANASIQAQATQQFTATGAFNDASDLEFSHPRHRAAV